MKKILVSFWIFLAILFSFGQSFAASISEIQERYKTILDKYEEKYWEKKLFIIMDKLDKRIDMYLQKSGLSPKKKEILWLLKEENKSRRTQESTTSTENSVLIPANSLDTQQLIREKALRWKLEAEISQHSNDKILDAFEKANYDILNTNSSFEYVKDNKIMRVKFPRYVDVNEENYKSLLRKNIFSEIWKFLIFDGEKYYIAQWSIEHQKKYPYSQSASKFLAAISRDRNYVLDEESYYTYAYEKYLFFKDNYGFYDDELATSGIQASKSILLRDDSWYKIIRDFEKKKLISASIISEVDDIEGFLSVVAKDANYTQEDDNDFYFKRLKTLSRSLSSWKSEKEAVENIYNHILSNHYYYENFLDGSEDIFSWIDTFRNGYGVCDGYTKLMYYMLAFAKISDIEHIRWYVIDAADFPEIGHAWVRIGDYYYDPTFDDPIGQPSTLTKDQYKYFRLPRAIAYTNRIDWFNASDELKQMSLSDRKKMVEKNLYAILDDFYPGQYRLLNSFSIKEQLGIVPWETLTIEKLKKNIPYYDISSDLRFTDEKWTTRRVTSVKYYLPTDDNLESVINTLWDQILDTVLFKWDLGWGQYEYRLAYELEVR